jgi:DNA-binding transcriptional ArsR family regulator
MVQSESGDVYRALADPNRRRILELLREQDRSVLALGSHLPITTGAVSQHLQLLRRSGLVSRTKRGKQRIYRLEARRLREIDAWLNAFRAFWEGTMDRLGQYLDAQDP